MVTLSEIQKKIAAAIRNSGKSQITIAKEIGISQSAVSHFIKGDILPALDTLANLCAFLDLDANDMLCIHGYAEKKTITVNNSFNNNSGKIDFKA